MEGTDRLKLLQAKDMADAAISSNLFNKRSTSYRAARNFYQSANQSKNLLLLIWRE
jgi:hypothetical protein